MLNTESVTRIENKYFITTNKKLELIKNLSKVLTEDSFGEKGYYSVRSVYFDKENCQDYLDKINQNKIRKGIRLRIYSPFDSIAKLELKFKNNDIQEKMSLKIKKNDAEELLNLNYEILKKYDGEIAKMFYIFLAEGKYKPNTTIAYNRKAFKSESSKIRITIDSNLQYSNNNFNIWNENLYLDTLLGTNEHILEVKFKEDNQLEQLNEIIYPLEILELPASKYKRCCKFLKFK